MSRDAPDWAGRRTEVDRPGAERDSTDSVGGVAYPAITAAKWGTRRVEEVQTTRRVPQCPTPRACQTGVDALRAWVPFLRDAVAAGLQLFDQEDRSRIFYRDLDDADFAVIRRLLERLLSHKVWDDPSPELNDLRYDNADRAKEMLRKFGLTPNWVLGGEA
jgi:hypothetical protein